MKLTVKNFPALYKEHGSVKAVARAFPGVSRETVRRKFYRKAVEAGLMDPQRVGGKTRADMKNPKVKLEEAEPVIEGSVRAKQTPKLSLPPKGKVNRYLFTCAQNNTKIHEPFWNNLQTFLSYLEATSHTAQMFVSRFTYVRSGIWSSSDKAQMTGRGKADLAGGVALWFDPRVEKYKYDDRLEIAPGLVWCGEMNIIPTASRPLSGMEMYTGRKSAIIPHVKIAMESVSADEVKDPTKFNYTTGTVTLRNYIQRKAGLKAEFHHCYAALLVEVDHEGSWWVRQINADSEGVFYDLDVMVGDPRVGKGDVSTGHRPKGITWGDPHYETSDPIAIECAFGAGGMKDQLNPEHDFAGDVLDFRARPWQEVRDPHSMFLRHVDGTGDVRREVAGVGKFIRLMHRPGCETVFVYGNHEEKMGRWLKEEDGRKDPLNAEFWMDMQRETYMYIRTHKEEPNYLEIALHLVDPDAAKMVTFLKNEDGYIICPDAAGGIQCGKHGHKGPRGSRGSPLAFAKMGRKTNLQHFHGARIIDGIYVAGTLEHLNPEWTKGSPSDWSHSQIVTYANGKRSIITFWKGKWRA